MPGFKSPESAVPAPAPYCCMASAPPTAPPLTVQPLLPPTAPAPILFIAPPATQTDTHMQCTQLLTRLIKHKHSPVIGDTHLPVTDSNRHWLYNHCYHRQHQHLYCSLLHLPHGHTCSAHNHSSHQTQTQHCHWWYTPTSHRLHHHIVDKLTYLLTYLLLTMLMHWCIFIREWYCKLIFCHDVEIVNGV